MLDSIVAMYRSQFDENPECVVRSPGRVNLIGDHTDYSDGFALPVAIDQATWIAAGARSDRTVKVVSESFGVLRFDLDHIEPSGTWGDYVMGMLIGSGADVAGFNAVVRSDLPVGAGLSSSASLELAVARVHSALNATPWRSQDAAIAAQSAENTFVGVSCGIMDQLVIASAVAGHALLIDCRSLELHPIRIPGRGAIVILDTGTRRQLSESAYGDRRKACERAANALNIPALRDATRDMVDHGCLDEVTARRARHVVAENERTLRVATLLAADDLDEVGELMNESHQSLRIDFEVSSPALDCITDLARSHPACFGARMTGGGFAGCAVALVERKNVDVFMSDVAERYSEVTGHVSALFPTSAPGGVDVVAIPTGGWIPPAATSRIG